MRPSQIGSYTWSYLVQLIILAAQVDKEAGAGRLLDDFMVEPFGQYKVQSISVSISKLLDDFVVEPLGQRRESSTPPSMAPLLTLCLLRATMCRDRRAKPVPPHNPHRYAR